MMVSLEIAQLPVFCPVLTVSFHQDGKFVETHFLEKYLNTSKFK